MAFAIKCSDSKYRHNSIYFALLADINLIFLAIIFRFDACCVTRLHMIAKFLFGKLENLI